jgi:predicted phosphodiesterase
MEDKIEMTNSSTGYNLARRRFIKLTGMATTGLLLNLCFSGKNKSIRFGLVTDSHYADREPTNTRFYRESLDKMKECIDVMNNEKVDFVIHLGDFKDEDQNKQREDTLKYLRAIEAAFGKFNGPRYHCVGNHDVDSITKQQFLTNIENTGISQDKSYYSFDSGDFHCVVLDSNFHEDGRDHFYKEGADWRNTNMPKVELEWLSEDLKSTDLPVVIFSHHPLHEYETHGTTYQVSNYEEIQQVLESQKNVVAVFQGHVHQERNEKVNGINYFTQLAMVDHSGPENNSFSIVSISEEQIQIDGYRRVSDQSYKHQV